MLSVMIRNKWEVLRWGGGVCYYPRPTPKLDGHPLSAVRDCLFSIFAATLHICRPSPPSATRGHAMPWWQGTHLAWTPSWHVFNLSKSTFKSENKNCIKCWKCSPCSAVHVFTLPRVRCKPVKSADFSPVRFLRHWNVSQDETLWMCLAQESREMCP
jgi:hypothetical protein